MTVHNRKKRPKINRKMYSHSRIRKVRLAIECSPLERRRMKILAASEDKTLNEFVLESVRMRFKRCSHSHTPNAKTVQAMQDAEKEKNLIEFDSL